MLILKNSIVSKILTYSGVVIPGVTLSLFANLLGSATPAKADSDVTNSWDVVPYKDRYEENQTNTMKSTTTGYVNKHVAVIYTASSSSRSEHSQFHIDDFGPVQLNFGETKSFNRSSNYIDLTKDVASPWEEARKEVTKTECVPVVDEVIGEVVHPPLGICTKVGTEEVTQPVAQPQGGEKAETKYFPIKSSWDYKPKGIWGEFGSVGVRCSLTYSDPVRPVVEGSNRRTFTARYEYKNDRDLGLRGRFPAPVYPNTSLDVYITKYFIDPRQYFLAQKIVPISAKSSPFAINMSIGALSDESKIREVPLSPPILPGAGCLAYEVSSVKLVSHAPTSPRAGLSGILTPTQNVANALLRLKIFNSVTLPSEMGSFAEKVYYFQRFVASSLDEQIYQCSKFSPDLNPNWFDDCVDAIFQGWIPTYQPEARES